MAERGVKVACSTILRCVTRSVSELEKRWNRYAKVVGTSRRVDETYVSIKAKWHSLYRAVDKHCKSVHFFFALRSNDCGERQSAANEYLNNLVEQDHQAIKQRFA